MPSVLVVREYDDFSRILTKAGFIVINRPTIEIFQFQNQANLARQLSDIESYDGVFLTSINAAQIFRETLRETAQTFSGKIYVLGNRTFQLLKNDTFDLVFDRTTNTAREMLEKIAPENLKDKRFLFVRGDKSLRVVPDFLSKIAAVEEVVVYGIKAAVISANEITAISEKIERAEIVCACFFSPSAAESFIDQFGTLILHQTIVTTIGKTTAEFFETRGLRVGFISSRATAEDFAIGLIEYLQNGKWKMENGK